MRKSKGSLMGKTESSGIARAGTNTSFKSIMSKLKTQVFVQIPPSMSTISSCQEGMIYRVGYYDGQPINQVCSVDDEGTAKVYYVRGDATVQGNPAFAAVKSLTRGATVGKILEGTQEITRDLEEEIEDVEDLLKDKEQSVADLETTVKKGNNPIAVAELNLSRQNANHYRSDLTELQQRLAGAQAGKNAVIQMSRTSGKKAPITNIERARLREAKQRGKPLQLGPGGNGEFASNLFGGGKTRRKYKTKKSNRKYRR